MGRAAIVHTTCATLVVLAFAEACSATSPHEPIAPGDSGGTGGTGASTAASGGGAGGEVGLGGSTPVGAGCSADLELVVDDNGHVIGSCAPDLGCFAGKCVAPCTAAAQSKGTIGCDFWALDPPFLVSGACYAV